MNRSMSTLDRQYDGLGNVDLNDNCVALYL